MTLPPEAAGESSGRKGRSPFQAGCILLALYFLTRLGSLSVLPIFLDEAVHLQWAERLYSEGRILRPIGAGRLLAVAAYGLALPFEDRLMAARAIAALAGAFVLVFTMLLSHRLFGFRAGVIAGTLYILSPFALVYDRLALSDGFLSAAMTGLMLAVFSLSHQPGSRPGQAMVAMLIILAILSKVSAIFFLAAALLGVLAITRERGRLFKSLSLASIIGLIGGAPILWLFASNGAEISAQHVVDPRIAGHVLVSTLQNMLTWVHSYFSIPALSFAALSLALLRDGRAVWLAGSVTLPFLLFALFSQPWSARYVLPTLPPFLILVAGGIAVLASRCEPAFRTSAAIGLTLLVSIPGGALVRDLLTDPSRAVFPADDRLQFVTGWPSGYGVRELAARLTLETSGGPAIVYVDTGGTRTLSTSLGVLLAGQASIRLSEGDFGSAEFRARMLAGPKDGAQVFAALGPRNLGLDFAALLHQARADRIEVYERPGGEWAATLFRLRALDGTPQP